MNYFFKKKSTWSLTALWKWKILISLLSISLILGSLYFLPLFQQQIQAFDLSFYQFIQKKLRFSTYIQTMLVLLSHPFNRLLFGSFSLALWVYWIKKSPRHLTTRKISELLYFSLLLFFSLFIRRFIVIEKITINGLDPMTQIFSQISLLVLKKKELTGLFPGIFSLILIESILMTWIILGFRKALIIGSLVLYFILPPLTLGIEGISDLFLGTASIALFSIAIGYFTPLHALFIQKIEFLIKKTLFIKNRA